MRWLRYKVVQIAISVALGLVAALGEAAMMAMKSYNDFYFGHKAYPYPYSSIHSAKVALAERCGLAFGLVFLAAIALQKFLFRKS